MLRVTTSFQVGRSGAGRLYKMPNERDFRFGNECSGTMRLYSKIGQCIGMGMPLPFNPTAEGS
jgi:hypothetical protein